MARIVYNSVSRKIPVEDLEGFGLDGLLQSASRYVEDRKASLATFAFRRIRGAMIDAMRASSREILGAPYDEPGSDDTAEDHLLEAERRRALTAAIARLSPRERHFIERVDLEGESLSEAGGKLNLSESRASRIRTRALARLRQAMADVA